MALVLARWSGTLMDSGTLCHCTPLRTNCMQNHPSSSYSQSNFRPWCSRRAGSAPCLPVPDSGVALEPEKLWGCSTVRKLAEALAKKSEQDLDAVSVEALESQSVPASVRTSAPAKVVMSGPKLVDQMAPRLAPQLDPCSEAASVPMTDSMSAANLVARSGGPLDQMKAPTTALVWAPVLEYS